LERDGDCACQDAAFGECRALDAGRGGQELRDRSAHVGDQQFGACAYAASEKHQFDVDDGHYARDADCDLAGGVLHDGPTELVAGARFACIGATTAEALRSVCPEISPQLADRPAMSALVEALERAYAEAVHVVS